MPQSSHSMMAWRFRPIRLAAEGGTNLLMIALGRPSLRMRSPGDEDGAHQGIVSLKYFFSLTVFSFSCILKSPFLVNVLNRSEHPRPSAGLVMGVFQPLRG